MVSPGVHTIGVNARGVSEWTSPVGSGFMSPGLSRASEAHERWEVISVWIVTNGMRKKEVVRDYGG